MCDKLKRSFLRDENTILRRLLWINHGHTGMYGDDGEMQCGECLSEYGFWDWKRTSAREIEEKINVANTIKKGGEAN